MDLSRRELLRRFLAASELHRLRGKAPCWDPFPSSGTEQFHRNFYDNLVKVTLFGDPTAVLTAARSPLINKLSGLDSTSLIAQILPPTDNLGSFGYRVGSLKNIMPPSLNAPLRVKPWISNLFSHNSAALLDARYGIPEQPYLVSARSSYNRVQATGGATGARYDDIVKGELPELPLLLSQSKFDLVGTAVYAIGVSTATSYRFFSQEQYDRVRTWEAYAAMFNQATSMRALSAYATQTWLSLGASSARHWSGRPMWVGTSGPTWTRRSTATRRCGSPAEVHPFLLTNARDTLGESRHNRRSGSPRWLFTPGLGLLA